MFHVAFGKPLRCTSGSVAVSTAIVAPMLIVVLANVVDVGRATYDATSLSGAVRAGTQYALHTPNNTTGIKAAVSAASTLSGDAIVPDAVQFCECPNGTSVSCSNNCGTEPLRKFVRVTATHSFSRIMSSLSVVIPSTLTAEAVVRIQ
jgi:hypothetical protein